MKSDNPCNTSEWLYYHYSRKNDYLEWCRNNHLKECNMGGQGLTLRECGSLAGVSAMSIISWLKSHKIHVRGKGEAQIGKYNHRSYLEFGDHLKRELRDRFFEQYRNEEINIIFGPRRFSNGVELDKEEIIIRRCTQYT